MPRQAASESAPTVIVTGASSGVFLLRLQVPQRSAEGREINAARVVTDAGFRQSGVHWRWGNRQQPGRRAFAQPLSARANDAGRASRLWAFSEQRVGLA